MISRFKLSLNVSSSTKSKNKNQGRPTPDLNRPHQFPGKEKRTGPFREQTAQKDGNDRGARPPQSQESCARLAGSTLVQLGAA